MTHSFSTLSRRRFIGGLASSALVVGAGGMFMPAFARDDVLDFRRSAKPLALNFNENSLGMAPSAIEAATRAVRDVPNRYPDNPLGVLIETLAAQHSVAKDQIVMGNGSTEIIQMVVTMAANMGATVIDPVPTFGDVRGYAAAENMAYVQVPVKGDFTTDLAAMRAAANAVSGPVLINICNPNNPTGTISEKDELFAWLQNAPANHIFLMDEAYYDYAVANPNYSSALPLIKADQDNVIVARTFSKVYGMAGMRVGYGIATTKTARAFSAFAASTNLNAAGIAAAQASLADSAFYAGSVASNANAKTILLNGLDALGLKHIESNTNFVLHRIESSVKPYQDRMRANGVKVGRRMTKEDGWNRLSIGTPEEMVEFVRILRAFRERGWV